jgi:hypothetical protein
MILVMGALLLVMRAMRTLLLVVPGPARATVLASV